MKTKLLLLAALCALQCASSMQAMNAEDLIRAVEQNDLAAIHAFQGDANELVEARQYNCKLNALHYAILTDRKKAAEVLLSEKHVDPNGLTGESAYKPKPTPRRLLGAIDYENFINLFEPRSPLHLAVEVKNEDMVSLLLLYGARPNVFDRSGCPPIYYAALKGLTVIALDLMAAGADPEEQFTRINPYKNPETKDKKLNAYTIAAKKTADAMRAYTLSKLATFAAINHPHCGAQSAGNILSAYLVQQIVNLLKPVPALGVTPIKCPACDFVVNNINEFKLHCGNHSLSELSIPVEPCSGRLDL